MVMAVVGALRHLRTRKEEALGLSRVVEHRWLNRPDLAERPARIVLERHRLVERLGPGSPLLVGLPTLVLAGGLTVGDRPQDFERAKASERLEVSGILGRLEGGSVGRDAYGSRDGQVARLV